MYINELKNIFLSDSIKLFVKRTVRCKKNKNKLYKLIVDLYELWLENFLYQILGLLARGMRNIITVKDISGILSVSNLDFLGKMNIFPRKSLENYKKNKDDKKYYFKKISTNKKSKNLFFYDKLSQSWLLYRFPLFMDYKKENLNKSKYSKMKYQYQKCYLTVNEKIFLRYFRANIEKKDNFENLSFINTLVNNPIVRKVGNSLSFFLLKSFFLNRDSVQITQKLLKFTRALFLNSYFKVSVYTRDITLILFFTLLIDFNIELEEKIIRTKYYAANLLCFLRLWVEKKGLNIFWNIIKSLFKMFFSIKKKKEQLLWKFFISFFSINKNYSDLFLFPFLKLCLFNKNNQIQNLAFSKNKNFINKTFLQKITLTYIFFIWKNLSNKKSFNKIKINLFLSFFLNDVFLL